MTQITPELREMFRRIAQREDERAKRFEAQGYLAAAKVFAKEAQEWREMADCEEAQ